MSGFSNPFDLSSGTKSELFLELQQKSNNLEKKSLSLSKSNKDNFDPSEINKDTNDLSNRVDFLLSLKPPDKEESEINKKNIYVKTGIGSYGTEDDPIPYEEGDDSNDGFSWGNAVKTVWKACSIIQEIVEENYTKLPSGIFIFDTSTKYSIWVSGDIESEEYETYDKDADLNREVFLRYYGLSIKGGFIGNEINSSDRRDLKSKSTIPFFASPYDFSGNNYDLESYGDMPPPQQIDGFSWSYEEKDKFIYEETYDPFIRARDINEINKLIISNCDFVMENFTKQQDASSPIKQIKYEDAALLLHDECVVVDCNFSGHNLNMEIIRSFPGSGRDGGKIQAFSPIYGPSSTFRNCSFKDMSISAYGVSGIATDKKLDEAITTNTWLVFESYPETLSSDIHIVTEILYSLISYSEHTYKINVEVKDIGPILGQAYPYTGTLGNIVLSNSLSGTTQFNDTTISFRSVILLHEVLHILGLILPAQNSTFYTGTHALNGYKNIMQQIPKEFNVDVENIQAVPLEDTGGTGTKFIHWEEEDSSISHNGVNLPIIPSEIMTGYASRSQGTYLTSMTAGALVDYGFDVNMDSPYIKDFGENFIVEISGEKHTLNLEPEGDSFFLLLNDQGYDHILYDRDRVKGIPTSTTPDASVSIGGGTSVIENYEVIEIDPLSPQFDHVGKYGYLPDDLETFSILRHPYVHRVYIYADSVFMDEDPYYIPGPSFFDDAYTGGGHGYPILFGGQTGANVFSTQTGGLGGYFIWIDYKQNGIIEEGVIYRNLDSTKPVRMKCNPPEAIYGSTQTLNKVTQKWEGTRDPKTFGGVPWWQPEFTNNNLFHYPPRLLTIKPYSSYTGSISWPNEEWGPDGYDFGYTNFQAWVECSESSLDAGYINDQLHLDDNPDLSIDRPQSAFFNGKFQNSVFYDENKSGLSSSDKVKALWTDYSRDGDPGSGEVRREQGIFNFHASATSNCSYSGNKFQKLNLIFKPDLRIPPKVNTILGKKGGDATLFRIAPFLWADVIDNCTFENCNLDHNAFDCDGANSESYSNEIELPSGPYDLDFTIDAILGLSGGNSQYGYSGNGANATRSEEGTKLISENSQYGKYFSDEELNPKLFLDSDKLGDKTFIYSGNGGNSAKGGDSGMTIYGKGVPGNVGLPASASSPGYAGRSGIFYVIHSDIDPIDNFYYFEEKLYSALEIIEIGPGKTLWVNVVDEIIYELDGNNIENYRWVELNQNDLYRGKWYFEDKKIYGYIPSSPDQPTQEVMSVPGRSGKNDNFISGGNPYFDLDQDPFLDFVPNYIYVANTFIEPDPNE